MHSAERALNKVSFSYCIQCIKCSFFIKKRMSSLAWHFSMQTGFSVGFAAGHFAPVRAGLSCSYLPFHTSTAVCGERVCSWSRAKADFSHSGFHVGQYTVAAQRFALQTREKQQWATNLSLLQVDSSSTAAKCPCVTAGEAVEMGIMEVCSQESEGIDPLPTEKSVMSRLGLRLKSCLLKIFAGRWWCYTESTLLWALMYRAGGSVWQLVLGTSMNLFRKLSGKLRTAAAGGATGEFPVRKVARAFPCWMGTGSILHMEVNWLSTLSWGRVVEWKSCPEECRALPGVLLPPQHTGTLLNITEWPATGRHWFLSANSHVGLQVAFKIWFHGIHWTSEVVYM